MEKIEKQLFDERESSSRNGEVVRDVYYLECRFWGSHFVDCLWENCRFKRVKFANGVVFENCNFKNTCFETAHTWLTGRFKDCSFENCIFAATSLGDVMFENCSFSGKFESMIFYGKKAPKNLRVVLKNVDFSGVKFKGTDFRMKVNLKTVVFPVSVEGLSIEGK